MNASEFNPFIFWAKLPDTRKLSPRERKNFKPDKFHPVLCHLLDVAAVTLALWDKVLPIEVHKRFAACLRVSISAARLWTAFLVALHDIGKLAPAFQFKLDARTLYEDRTSLLYRLYQQQHEKNSLHTYEAYHQWITTITLPAILTSERFGIEESFAKRIADILGGHHGEFPHGKNFNDLSNEKNHRFKLCVGEGIWDESRHAHAAEVARLIGVDVLQEKPRDIESDFAPHGEEIYTARNAFAMLFAGFTTVADWVGSNASFFKLAAKVGGMFPQTSDEYFNKTAQAKAQEVLDQLGWLANRKSPARQQSFAKLFAYLAHDNEEVTPNSLQLTVENHLDKIAREPALVIVEAAMGKGKSETAMMIADRLNVRTIEQSETGSERVSGCYFALPTQATSNQMFGRVKDFLTHRFGEEIQPQLLHGHASIAAELKTRDQRYEVSDNQDEQLEHENKGNAEEARTVAEEWFTHRKRGLLAPYGVGTIDQILLAALETRHFFVRLYGLAHKTVIIDEVHAYDAYMTELLERLLEWLAALRSSVVLLSATLPAEKRLKLMNAYRRGCGEENDKNELPDCAYPRVTWTHGAEIHPIPVPIEKEDEKVLRVEWTDGDVPEEGEAFPLGELLLERLRHGGCAAVICNTVDRAQQMYSRLRDEFERAKQNGEPHPKLYLLHARFLFEDRDLLVKKMLRRFSKPRSKVEFGKDFNLKMKRPRRAVLVATQIIEQSLDLDFDLMVSDFAPLDLLLQRAGRIHRHRENDAKRYNLTSPTLLLCRPEVDAERVPQLADGSHIVYSEHILLRSWLALPYVMRANHDAHFEINFPRGIEEYVEKVYRGAGNEEELFPEVEDVTNSLRQRWQDAKNEYLTNLTGDKEKAVAAQINYPYTEELFLETFSQEPRKEDSPELHPAHQALTRLGESIQVVCLYGTRQQPCIDEECKEHVNLKSKPDDAMTKKLLRRSVTISTGSPRLKQTDQNEVKKSANSVSLQEIVKHLKGESVLEGWQKSPLLRHYRYVILDERGEAAKQSRFSFSRDEKLGILIRRHGRGREE